MDINDDITPEDLADGIEFMHEEEDEEEFTDCGGGRRAMLRNCQCDACVTAADDLYHQMKEDGYF